MWKALWQEHLETHGASKNTVRAYASDAGDFATWFAEAVGMEFSPSMLTGHDLRAYRRHLRQERRLSASTVNRRMEALRQLAQWAQERGSLNADVEALFDGIRKVRQVEPAIRWLTESEYHRVMRTVEQAVNTGIPAGAAQKRPTEYGRMTAIRDWAAVVLMVLAGLRVGEVAALRVGDVVLRERSGHVVVYGGKGDKDRVVPLNAEARRALRAWLDMRRSWDADAPLFTGRGGAPWDVGGIGKRVRAIGRVAGVDGLTPHRLRHTFGRRFMVANRERLGDDALMALAQLMGHERLETTRRYARPGQADIAAALEGV